MKDFTPTSYTLECVATGREFPDEGWTLDDAQCKCPSLIRTRYAKKQLELKSDEYGFYKFADWLPVRRMLENSKAPVTYKSKGLAAHLGLENLYITFNGYYPAIGAHMTTCSFKETEAYSVCARIDENEKRVLVVASAGNTARAFAKVCSDNNIKLLVTVGGDDTASTANRIAKFLEAKKYPIANIHVPKTIDNDLPLPKGTPTFGYESAKDKGAVIARAVYVDARTSGNWFVLAAMGRSAGHLAFGIGEACHYPMIVIPEMFDKTEITVEKIVNLVISSIIKRKIMGMDYGAAVISEGVFHALSDEEIRKSGIHFTYDEHGHPELGKVSKAHIFNEMIEMKLKELGLKVKSRPVELGYEIRCQTPIAYDLTYCSELGIGVHKLFAEGKTGCMVYVDSEGNVNPLYLKDLQDPTTGKIPPRLVDIKSDKFSSVVDNIINAITPADYEAAKQYVTNPEEYDFHKILNWK